MSRGHHRWPAQIREDLIAESGNDLRVYVEAARKRQIESGRPVVSRPSAAKVELPLNEMSRRRSF